MENKVDQNLYSRQIATYGAEAMGKLVTLKVLVVGLQGVGIETAKNLVLAGPAQVHLLDDQLVQIKDLGVNFYCKESNVGKISRAEASQAQLKELNPLVDVQVKQGGLTPELLSQYSVVIVTDFYNKQQLIDANNFCRSKDIGFIYSGNLGLYGFAFVDYGKEHIVFDTNGEAVKNTIVVNITKGAEDCTVTVHEDKRHGFEDGDTVIFREVEGMTQINEKQVKIKNTKSHSFQLELDTSSFNDYTGQGVVEQVKVQQPFAFKSLEESLPSPFAPGRSELDMLDWEKFGVPEQLHLVLNAVLEFTAKNNGQLPQLNNQDDAKALTEIAEKVNADYKALGDKAISIEQFNEDLIKNVSLYARTNISPFASFFGGIVAQEAIKFTGKYTPLRQWLHHEVFEALSEEQNVDRVPCGTRYDDIISIWGKDFMEKLSRQKAFMIGAGALGCEFLKMFALMGMGSAQGGKFTVTDDDQIEISNLNRQFLFRRENVGHSKSECAANAVRNNMNNSFNVEAYKLRVCPENEQYFTDDFWTNLDFVVNAVDNVKARLFVDGRCVWYHKPLFESGTLGTKCNSQVVIPKFTQSYGDSVDPPEEGIPLCTLKNFPNQIEHCIQYARDKFEEYLVEGPNECIKYIQNPQEYIKQTKFEYSSKPGIFRSKLETVKKLAHAYLGGKYENLVQLARNLWAENFHNQIASLLNAYPVDAKTSEGAAFWSGPKRAPQILDFSPEDEEHINFIQSCANILAHVFGVEQEKDRNVVKKIVAGIDVPKFVPKKIAIKVNEKDTTEEKAEDDEEIINVLVSELSNLQISQRSGLNPTEFEKDDPTNWHIDFVASLANLRARNYKIKEVSPFQVKIIAGKIIPALATTTAMVVGAVGIEILKCILGKPVSKMRNSFMNLALPLWLFSEPLAPIEAQDKDYDEVLMGPVKAVPPKFTTWDKIFVKGPMTLKQFIANVKEVQKVEASIISSGKICLYNSYGANAQDNIDLDMVAIIEKLSGETLPSYKKFLEIEVCGEIDGIDATMPTFKYQFRD